MDEVVGSVNKVSDLIAEIAASSEEQSSGIGQINTAVSQMDHVVQQNASLVEEAAAATESMKEQAVALLQLVARFKLGDGPSDAKTTVQVAVHQPLAFVAVPPPPIKITAGRVMPGSSYARREPTRLRRAQSGDKSGWSEF
jgi:methyl-accepting chemotaxis protein